MSSGQMVLSAANVAIADDDADIGVARFYAHDPFGNRLEFVAVKDEGFTTRLSGNGAVASDDENS